MTAIKRLNRMPIKYVGDDILPSLVGAKLASPEER